MGNLTSSGINNAYNTGAVSCGSYTGGIVGSLNDNSATTIQYTVNIGTITNQKPSDTNAGAIMGGTPGVSSGTVADNYYWSTAYASDKSSNATSISQTSDFASLSTFTNFSNAIWQIQNSLGGSITSRPTLIAMPE